MSVKFIQSSKKKKKPNESDPLIFGQNFTDHMFIMEHNAENGWHNARVQPYQPFVLDPASLCFHYGQTLFEGMKAYTNDKGEILLFRPEKHLKRMQEGCRRLCIPDFDIALALKGLVELLKIERDWIPKEEGSSLYIRPTIIATQPTVGIRTSTQYYFYVILSPAGSYYAEGFKPIDIHVEDEFIRAAVGGTGNVKTGGNYVGTLLAAYHAQKKGFAQVLWLDAKERKYIEEVGAMNVFFVMDGKVVTPPLTGSILPGVTRESVIEILNDWKIPVAEESITIDDVVAQCQSGQLTECFGTGTAAIIAPVGRLGYQGKKYTINHAKVGTITQRLYNHLLKLQRNETPTHTHWVYKVGA
jgi:branched-chain amino acid aminotransferase